MERNTDSNEREIMLKYIGKLQLIKFGELRI